MTPRELIAEAWAITQRETTLRRWGFFSSFFQTLLNVKLIGYQLYFLHAYLVGHEVGFFDDFYWLYDNVDFWVFCTIMILFFVLLFIEFIVPNLAQGAIIGLAAKSHKKQPVEGGFILALYNFFPILGIHEFLIFGSWSMCLTFCSLILRYIQGDLKYTMVVIMLIFFVLTNILRFFFSFAEPDVVIRKDGIFSAMGASFKMIMSYLTRVMFLTLLLFIISLRVLLNTIIVLVIPAVVVGLGFLLTLVLPPLVSYSVTGIIGMLLIIGASYLFASLHVFKETVWTITYLELRKNKDLDLID